MNTSGTTSWAIRACTAAVNFAVKSPLADSNAFLTGSRSTPSPTSVPIIDSIRSFWLYALNMTTTITTATDIRRPRAGEMNRRHGCPKVRPGRTSDQHSSSDLCAVESIRHTGDGSQRSTDAVNA